MIEPVSRRDVLRTIGASAVAAAMPATLATGAIVSAPATPKVPTWQEKLRKSIEAAGDGGWLTMPLFCPPCYSFTQDEPWVSAQWRGHIIHVDPAEGFPRKSWLSLNASPLAGRPRGMLKISEIYVFPHSTSIYVCIAERRDIPWSHYPSREGAPCEYREWTYADGTSRFFYFDFDAIG